MGNLRCPKCGAENEAEAKRCKECDSLLFDSQEESSTASDATAAEDIKFDSQDKQDLPDLLHALKQDGEISSDGQVHEDRGEDDGSEILSPDTSQSEAEIPDWLRRIRERAKKEADAAGDITQKLTAAQESVTDGKLETQHENFASWIQSLRGETDEEIAESHPEEQGKNEAPSQPPEETPEWLSNIRKVKGATTTEGQSLTSDPEEKKGDSLLQWLVALEEGKETVQQVPEEHTDTVEPPSEESLHEGLDQADEAGEATQRIPALAVDSHKKDAPELNASREEQLRANIFSSTVVDEQAQRPIREQTRKTSSWVIRVIAAIFLIGTLSVALFGIWPGDRFAGPLAANETMLASIEALPEEASLLVVADYQAGFAEEIHLIARPILSEAFGPEMQIALISTRPSGVLLSRRLLAELPDEIELEIKDLGFFPSSAFGAYALANFSQWDRSWMGLAESSMANLPTDLDGIFILADTYESAIFWVEQISPRLPDTPLYLLVTAQAGPMLAPYEESGQIAGIVAGLSNAEIMESNFNEEGLDLHLRRAYQMGTLLLAVMIVFGAILAIKPKSEEKNGGTHGLE